MEFANLDSLAAKLDKIIELLREIRDDQNVNSQYTKCRACAQIYRRGSSHTCGVPRT